MTHAFAATALALVMLGMSGPSRAADTAPPNAAPDAEASDPRALGWMQGFPPPPDKRLSAADGSFFRFPALRWSVVHMREFLPTVEVSRGLGAPVPLPVALDGSIDAIRFTPTGARAPMTWKASLAANYTDGLVVLHRGLTEVIACHAPAGVITRSVRLAIVCSHGIRLAATYAT